MEKTTCKTCGRNIVKGNVCKNCKSKVVKVGSVLLTGIFSLVAVLSDKQDKK